MRSYTDKIYELACSFVPYDPNCQQEEDEILDVEEPIDEEDEDDEYVIESDSGDDDTTWAVRCNAVKVLKTCTKRDMYPIKENFKKIGRLLIVRFQDRNETVKLEVIKCSLLLLQKVIEKRKINGVIDLKNDILKILPITISRISIFYLL